MTNLQTCDNVAFMIRKKLGESEIAPTESLRFNDPVERERLNEVLRDLRNKADGAIPKAHFFKALIGLKGYSLRNFNQDHKLFLAGEISKLPAHGRFPLIPKRITRKSKVKS